MNFRGNLSVIISSLAVLALTTPVLAASTTPRLVLQITVDALRGDLPNRYYNRLGENGFRYLWEKGTLYTDAHHTHANTETVVGHTTLATGATPAVHGMIANLWFDRSEGRKRYNIEDDRYRLLTAGAGVDKEAEIDSTQAAAKSDGRSPAAIMVTTLSDEMTINTAGQGLCCLDQRSRCGDHGGP